MVVQTPVRGPVGPRLNWESSCSAVCVCVCVCVCVDVTAHVTAHVTDYIGMYAHHTHTLTPSHTTHHTTCTLPVLPLGVEKIDELLKFILVTKHSLTLGNVQVVVRETNQGTNQSAVASL